MKKTNSQTKAGRKQTKNKPLKPDRKTKKQSQIDRKQLIKHG